MASILSYPIIKEVILPFVLVFVLIFAILQKSEVLGKGKAQIDALISLVIALILVVTPPARDFIVNIMPWLAVGVSVILVFLILYGMVGDNAAWKATWVKVVFGILSGIFVIGVIIYASGFWPDLKHWFSGSFGSDVWANVIFVIIVIAAILVAVLTGKNTSSGKPS